MIISVVGLGYVGLPLALLLSEKGYSVTGIDKNNEKIEKLKKGILTFANNEPQILDLLARQKKHINFSTTFDNISNSRVIIIAVDTPVNSKKPDYTSLKTALKKIGKRINKGSVLVIESTISPGTTESVIRPIITKASKLSFNKDVFVAVAPERIRPNHTIYQIQNWPKLIGVSSPEITKLLKGIYRDLTKGEIDIVDTKTAETVKTVENTLRDVNIAFANQIALACEELGVNVWDVIRLVNKSPVHNMLNPGPGVGGHCIPKDPWLLYSSLKNKPSIIYESRKTNDNMPSIVLNKIAKWIKEEKIESKKIKICILGYSYLEESEDTRNSPSKVLVNLLKKNNFNYVVHDPFVEEYQNNLASKLKESNCLVMMVAHKKYKSLTLNKIYTNSNVKIIVDTKNFFNKNDAQKKGFRYYGIGNI